MDDPRVLRIITVGLFLAALAVGYFLLTGGFNLKSKKVATSIVEQASPVPSAVEGISVQPSSVPQSAYNRIANRSQAGVKSLPKTGFPEELAFVFSISAMVSGWHLRKFSK